MTQTQQQRRRRKGVIYDNQKEAKNKDWPYAKIKMWYKIL